MALTEAQAGSSLSDVKTSAVKAKDGDHYLITGTKVFISSGDHDLAENIVHPVLARLPGAPLGVKGISLFIVPKYRPGPDGGVGEPNDVATGGIEHKMGLRGQATATLNFGENGDCRGWLMGEPNKGLAYMFQLMNGARIATGVQATGVAANAYQHALEYARERHQGRDVKEKDPGHASGAHHQAPGRAADAARAEVVHRGDVRPARLLRVPLRHEPRRRDRGRARARPRPPRDPDPRLQGVRLGHLVRSPRSSPSRSTAGYGFSEEFPLAQMLRDQKVFSIYEGTNNIQAMDLLGRKVVMKGGASFKALVAEVRKTLQQSRDVPALKDVTDGVEAALGALVETTQRLAALSADVSLYMSFATPYLRMFSQVVVSWQLLWQAAVAQKALDAKAADEAFYRGKLAAARFYVHDELPSVHTLAGIIKAGNRVALDCREEWL